MGYLSVFFTYSNYISLGLFVIVIILLFTQLALYIKLRRFLKGADATSLESRIIEALTEVASLKKHDEMLAKHALDIEKRLSTSVRNVSILRFKALENNASNQSFAVALLDEQGDGVVITSLHLRDRLTTYAKPISKYTSTHDLTDEEKQVIHDTREGQKK